MNKLVKRVVASVAAVMMLGAPVSALALELPAYVVIRGDAEGGVDGIPPMYQIVYYHTGLASASFWPTMVSVGTFYINEVWVTGERTEMHSQYYSAGSQFVVMSIPTRSHPDGTAILYGSVRFSDVWTLTEPRTSRDVYGILLDLASPHPSGLDRSNPEAQEAIINADFSAFATRQITPAAPAPTPVAVTAPAGRPTPLADLHAGNFPVGSTQTVDYANALNVRRGAGVSHPAFNHLLRGDEITVLEFRGGWVRIDTNFGEGWIFAGYLRR